jgi:hypothetical protein
LYLKPEHTEQGAVRDATEEDFKNHRDNPVPGSQMFHGKGIYFNAHVDGSKYPGMVYYGDFDSNMCHGQGQRTWLTYSEV